MFKIFNNLLKTYTITKHVQIPQQRTKTKLVKIKVNGIDYEVPSGLTVMQALRLMGIILPSFCYHKRLSIAGNCRMCMVDVKGMWKRQIACGINVTNEMDISTTSGVTMVAQESVLEFILADHPLDCPVCDQGGECDLQDLTMRFGNDRSRFTEIHFTGKRAVEDNDLGPFIRSCMNRCIHCTRCIRFGSQVCGIDVLGTTGRGHDMLVGTYVDKMFLSEISGNVIDLCPVGSLTSIPYMFKARPWEVRRTDSIDVTDATGTNIVLNYRFDRVIRVLPREHEDVNQEWVSDKGRWAIDSLDMQRLVSPMAQINGKLQVVDWDFALRTAACLLKGQSDIAAVAGPHCNVETLVACKDLINYLGSEQTYVNRTLLHTITGSDLRCAYSLNIPFAEIPKADRIVLIGTNPRFEAPILNVWIRQAYRTNECDIYVIGPKADYNYYVTYLDKLESLHDALKGAKRPLIFVGLSMLKDGSGEIMKRITKLNSALYNYKFPTMNFIPLDASFTGALEAGWKLNAQKHLAERLPKVLILLGCDDLTVEDRSDSCEIIYIGFQGDKGAQSASLVLPGSAYTEVGGTYMNMENRTQVAMPAVTPPGKARSDWRIVRAIAEYCCVPLPYDNHKELRVRMGQVSPAFNCPDVYQYNLFGQLLDRVTSAPKGKGGDCSVTSFSVPMKTLRDYYCSDVFTYNSPNMVKGWRAACKYEKCDYAKN